MSWGVGVEIIKKKCHLDIGVCIHLGGIFFLFLKWLINLLIIRHNSLLIEVREALKMVGLGRNLLSLRKYGLLILIVFR